MLHERVHVFYNGQYKTVSENTCIVRVSHKRDASRKQPVQSISYSCVRQLYRTRGKKVSTERVDTHTYNVTTTVLVASRVKGNGMRVGERRG